MPRTSDGGSLNNGPSWEEEPSSEAPVSEIAQSVLGELHAKVSTTFATANRSLCDAEDALKYLLKFIQKPEVMYSDFGADAQRVQNYCRDTFLPALREMDETIEKLHDKIHDRFLRSQRPEELELLRKVLKESESTKKP